MLIKSASLGLFTALLMVLPISNAHSQNHSQNYSEQRQSCADHDPLMRPYFGDLHVHTRYSLDASTQDTRTSPAQAYQFSRGERIGIQPWTDEGKALRSLQLRRPLDFAMVSDHAELIGEVHMCNTPSVEGYGSWQCMLFRHLPRAAFYLFNYTATMRQTHLGQCGKNGQHCLEAARAPWAEIQQAAEKYYDRSSNCAFTAFVGYEWTGMEGDSGGNLHRNVVFRNAKVPALPQSFIDGPSAIQLWRALDDKCNQAEGECDSLVIPHNSNLSAGFMFSNKLDDGREMTSEYASLRQRFEPLTEIMQHKGASECFYGAGTADELCAFEQQPKDNIAGYDSYPKPETGFVRQALLDGMSLQQRLGINPYKFGIIASTDTHLGAPGATEEDRFLGHGGDGVPARDEVPPGLPDKLEFSPGGLAVLWAPENSRDALFDAMRRKEAYGTSGPRIISRFFGGWSIPEDACQSADPVALGYEQGVPMGSDLPAGDGVAPSFLISASQDSGTADSPGMPLQRIQVIKGWLDEQGQSREKVIDVAGNPNNGASVDTRSCETSGDGYANLCTVWTDSEFDPTQKAFYYTRVVENPSCRWSQRMCVAAGVDCALPETIGDGYEDCCAAEHRPVIQERAWSSPIWYKP